MKRTTTLIATALIALVAGCSSTNPGSAAARSATAAVSTAVSTPTRTATTATVTQYASALNGPISGVQDTWQTYTDAGCLIDNSEFACTVTPLTLNAEAETIVLVIDGSAKPGVPAYIGPPPAEIAKLVADTRADAEQVYTDTADSDHLPDGWAGDVLTLMNTLDRWGPYL